MATVTRKQIAKILDEQSINVEKFVVRKNGDVDFYRDYFYRFGSTAEEFGRKLAGRLDGFSLVETTDRLAAWPKSSYFIATIRKAEIHA